MKNPTERRGGFNFFFVHLSQTWDYYFCIVDFLCIETHEIEPKIIYYHLYVAINSFAKLRFKVFFRKFVTRKNLRFSSTWLTIGCICYASGTKCVSLEDIRVVGCCCCFELLTLTEITIWTNPPTHSHTDTHTKYTQKWVQLAKEIYSNRPLTCNERDV